MIDIVLLLIIISQSVLLAWFDWNNRKERKSLINAIKAKDIVEYAQLEVADKVQVKVDKQKTDLISMNDLSDEEFSKAIDEENKRE